MRLIASLFVLASLGVLTTVHANTILDHANGYTFNSKSEVVHFASLAFGDDGKVIAIGSAADMAVRAPKARHNTGVLQTWVAGRQVYQKR